MRLLIFLRLLKGLGICTNHRIIRSVLFQPSGDGPYATGSPWDRGSVFNGSPIPGAVFGAADRAPFSSTR